MLQDLSAPTFNNAKLKQKSPLILSEACALAAWKHRSVIQHEGLTALLEKGCGFTSLRFFIYLFFLV